MSHRITYPQWFALLAMKHFGPIPADRCIRQNTLESLVRRGLAEPAAPPRIHRFQITEEGLAAEDAWVQP